uniref:F-box domain-containing protein n=1 Tax=Caenorhabditis japonica TaxID=281687 RepID=A0A8R1HG08_CAEJA
MSWSDLPFDVRQKCVKNLDFSTCICLRACSKSDRQLVDSVPLKLPRVRFARKLERALLVFHTGVNEYLRIEYRGDDGELMVLRNTPENSDRKTKRKIKLEISPYDLATSTFVGILSRENLELGTLEIGQPDHEKDGRIEKLLIPNNFRFQKIAYDCTYRWKLDGQKTFYNSTGCTNQEMIHYTFTQQENVAMSRHQVMFVGDVCDFRLVNGVKVVSNRPVFYVNVPQESPGVPMKVLFDYLLCASKRLVPRGVLHVRFPHTDEKTGYEMFKACPGEFHQFDTGIMMKRIAPTHGFVHRFYCSPCGFYVQLLKENAEKDLESAWSNDGELSLEAYPNRLKKVIYQESS